MKVVLLFLMLSLLKFDTNYNPNSTKILQNPNIINILFNYKEAIVAAKSKLKNVLEAIKIMNKLKSGIKVTY